MQGTNKVDYSTNEQGNARIMPHSTPIENLPY